jgi:esterase
VLESDHPVVKSHFPQARIEVIAESGHNPHMDAREGFVRTVLASL